MTADITKVPCIAVWGAGGFIGRHAVDVLLQSGWRVRGLGRGAVPDLACAGYESRCLDLAATEYQIAAALDGVACVVHCAGHYHATDDAYEDYIGSVRSLARAALQTGVDRLVLISSIAVYGATPATPVTTSTAPQPETAYARSRWRAEQVAREELAAGNTRLIVVRVPSVVGADMKSDVLRRFFRTLHLGVFFHPGRADAVFACVGIHRLAACIAEVADPRIDALPTVLQPVDCIPWVELAQRFGRATGRRMPRLGLPAAVVRPACRMLGIDVANALQALDNPVRYRDDCTARLAGPLPETADDIDALIAVFLQATTVGRSGSAAS